MPHVFVDISAHGLGHLAQTAPVLDALAARSPSLRLTIRSGLAEDRLRLRIAQPFTHLPASSDVSFLMHDATRVDRERSAAAYRAAHADWPAQVAAEADFLTALAPDLVLANVSALPLAGARAAGIPAAALCSLNWADQFAFLFAGEDWAASIHAQLHAAYAGAEVFLRCLPATAMPTLPRVVDLPPIARVGRAEHAALAAAIGAGDERLVLVGMGGIGFDLPLAQWPQTPGIRWLVRGAPAGRRPDVTDYGALGWHFSDLLASVDAVVTKPGYGMFVEAAAAGTPLLYLRRDDWPEQDALIDWLAAEAVCAELAADDFSSGGFVRQLAALWRQPRRRVAADGAAEAARQLLALLADDGAAPREKFRAGS
ncbi:hypothetical protein [Azospira restricta]|uniref:hypothetical protein n=1 Tax=Azospira restricta TaxID=404405 RepID=UPI00193BE025|nr:hypothetical protein [Azospira restricta]